MPGVAEAEHALGCADEAFARFDVDGVVAHLSAAIRGFTEAGDACRAAMACVRLGDAYANALGNLTAARAWFARAKRLVDGEPPCLEQGWVAVAAMGCDVDDPDELLEAAELALERARRFGDVNLETKALADAGLAHVQAGRIADGMRLLDEAMALACGPVDDVDVAGKSACSFFTACYFAADFERAGSWAAVLRQHGLIGSTPGAPVFLSSHCNSVQATLLIELGRWGQAEEVLLDARSEFETAMHMPSWHPDIALADLRIRQGRLAEAEHLLLGKEQSMQALLPAARLHRARGDHDLARATALRGLRAMGRDRLRAVELLAVLVDAELANGHLEAAADACARLRELVGDLQIPAIDARGARAAASVSVASHDVAGAISVLEAAVDRLDHRQVPWLCATLLIELARLRGRSGDSAGASVDARAASTLLATIDVVLAPEDVAVLERHGARHRSLAAGDRTAELRRDGKWWTVSSAGTSVRLPDSKGMRYLAELLRRPGTERHALDLVDLVEGVAAPGALTRRALGDAGAVSDATARTAYRHRVESLRAEIDDALHAGHLDNAEALQTELDQLVAHLAQAFGLGGRDRRAASAAERARLNVTRALRSAIAKLSEAMPQLGAELDRRVRTGLYCAYEPASEDTVRWIVQSRVNGTSAG